MDRSASIAIVWDRDGRSEYLPMAVPFAYRQVVQDLPWRKWLPQRRAWMVPRDQLPALVAQLEGAGCSVVWRQPGAPDPLHTEAER